MNNLSPGHVEAGLLPLLETSIFPTKASFPGSGPFVFNGILYYAAAPFSVVVPGSSQSSEFGGGDPTKLGSCVVEGPSSIVAGTLTSEPVSSLGFTLPFSAE